MLCRRCSIVTSAFHMPRSRAIFERCFALAGDSLYGDCSHFQLDFHAVRDEGAFPEDVLAARHQREAKSLEVHFFFKPGLCAVRQRGELASAHQAGHCRPVEPFWPLRHAPQQKQLLYTVLCTEIWPLWGFRIFRHKSSEQLWFQYMF